MADMMMFPNTVEEFMEQYKIVDTEKIYTNGTELVPIFRMMQWFEHVSATDTISRQAAIDALRTCYDTETITMDNGDEYINYGDAVGEIEQLPPIQPKLLQPWEVLVAQAVLPQPKMGKWIYHIDDLFPAESTMECNQCHAEQPLTCDDEFCPHCGANMEVTDG